MRFINTKTLKFQDVFDGELPRLRGGYSILSHRWTWGNDEILYTDIVSPTPETANKGGYSKFVGACALARKLGHELIWIDTCCINKTDSVELGEAINSMYRWYALSTICIAYLQDVKPLGEIQASEWFTRGWTLQELIAPREVHFYDEVWNLVGDKASLSETIAMRTRIPDDVLRNLKRPQACSIAQRMSWAAKRTTARVEDRAYSLIGLFGVNMPMIYGERERAFIRLQELIMSKSTDETIFAWDLDLVEEGTRDAKQVHCSLLATSPACFERCGDIVSLGRSKGFQVDQFGLSLSVPASQAKLESYYAFLKAGYARNPEQCIGIVLNKMRDDEEGNYYARTSTPSGKSLVGLSQRTAPREWLTQFKTPLEQPDHETSRRLYHGFWLRQTSLQNRHSTHHDIHVFKRFDSPEKDRMPLPDRDFGTASVIRLTCHDSSFVRPVHAFIRLGFENTSSSVRPVCLITFPKAVNFSGDIYSAKQDHFTDPGWELYFNNFHGVHNSKKQRANRTDAILFDDDWIDADVAKQILSRVGPSYSFHSRLSAQHDGNGCVHYDSDGSFRAKYPTWLGLTISISIQRVPDTQSPGERDDVWAVDLSVDD